jgi:L-fucose isomerase-like protein
VVGEIYAEDQAVLAQRADALAGSAQVVALEKWMKKQGAEVRHDKAIFTPEIWRRQLGLLIAARERLAQIGGKHPLLAVSVKCRTELSDTWGVTACSLPAMLPFGEGPVGPTPPVPTICEGDVMSLLGAALLGRLGGGVPPLFGDVASLGPGWVHVSNCGGMALWWAAQTHAAGTALKRLTICPQCHGRGGGAWQFLGVEMDIVTVVQIGKRAGAPAVAVGLAKPRLVKGDEVSRRRWGAPWPVVKLTGPFEETTLAARAISDHALALPGERVREVAHWAAAEGFEVLEFGEFGPLTGI